MPAMIWAFIVSIIGPLVRKVLVALGVGFVTYQGLDLALDAAKSQVISAWGSMGGDVANLVSLAGFGQAFGIILGAIAARAALVLVTRMSKIASS